MDHIELATSRMSTLDIFNGVHLDKFVTTVMLLWTDVDANDVKSSALITFRSTTSAAE